MKTIQIGEKYGLLTIVSECRMPRKKRGKISSTRAVLCICDCGNEYRSPLYPILSGTVISCGCFNKKTDKLIGKTYGKLTFIEILGGGYFKCRCDCGIEKRIHYYAIVKDQITSCGCDRKTHGLSKHRVYGIHQAIIARCTNPKAINYERYGGRGITVCERWEQSFDNFYEDMGMPPTDLHTIERKDNNKGYDKNNCYWATYKEQARNRRSNVFIEYNGVKKCLAEWAETYNLDKCAFSNRIKRGWSFEKAISIPIIKKI